MLTEKEIGSLTGKVEERLVGQWSFENSLEDTAAAAHGTFSDGEPIYVTGTTGNGILLDGVNDYVVLGDSADLNFGSE